MGQLAFVGVLPKSSSFQITLHITFTLVLPNHSEDLLWPKVSKITSNLLLRSMTSTSTKWLLEEWPCCLDFFFIATDYSTAQSKVLDIYSQNRIEGFYSFNLAFKPLPYILSHIFSKYFQLLFLSSSMPQSSRVFTYLLFIPPVWHFYIGLISSLKGHLNAILLDVWTLWWSNSLSIPPVGSSIPIFQQSYYFFCTSIMSVFYVTF